MANFRALFELIVFHAMPKELELKLQPGDAAPDFTAPTNDGGTVTLSKLKGKSVVLYFYPRDDTPGCTKEACGFRDAWKQFEKKGAMVLGVSPDTAKSHDKFAAKFKLPFTLVADEDKKIVTAYGVWGEKVFMGRKYQGTHRVTFLIGPDGKIKAVWPKVKPDEHAAEVLATL
jgi:peroxiredoxin Q/BCP